MSNIFYNIQLFYEKEQYKELPLEDRQVLERLALDNEIEVLDVRIKSPDNPVRLMEAKLLVFRV